MLFTLAMRLIEKFQLYLMRKYKQEFIKYIKANYSSRTTLNDIYYSYRTLLNRPPDLKSWEGWCERIAGSGNQFPLEDALSFFIYSEEYELIQKTKGLQTQSLSNAKEIIYIPHSNQSARPVKLVCEQVKTKDGFSIYLNSLDVGPITTDIRKNQCWEPDETSILVNHCFKRNRDFVFVDVGANIGYFSRLAAKYLNNKGKIIAIEPDPVNYSFLELNLFEDKKDKDVQLFRCAVGARLGKAKLFLSPFNLGDHQLYAVKGNDQIFDGGRERKSVDVNVSTIDTLLKDFNKVDFLKIDTQGFEIDILQGSIETLKKFKPKILLEFWPYGLQNNGKDPLEIKNILTSLGYQISKISSNSKLESYDFSHLQDLKENSINLLAIHAK